MREPAHRPDIDKAVETQPMRLGESLRELQVRLTVIVVHLMLLESALYSLTGLSTFDKI